MNADLALRLSKIVHDNCKDVPHDIGISLAEAVEKFQIDPGLCTCEFVVNGNYCHSFRNGLCANKEKHFIENDPTGEMIFCDDCKYFPNPDSPTWDKKVMGGKNVCERKLPMLYKMPNGHPDINTDFGFYHKNCRFFESIL